MAYGLWPQWRHHIPCGRESCGAVASHLWDATAPSTPLSGADGLVMYVTWITLCRFSRLVYCEAVRRPVREHADRRDHAAVDVGGDIDTAKHKVDEARSSADVWQALEVRDVLRMRRVKTFPNLMDCGRERLAVSRNK